MARIYAAEDGNLSTSIIVARTQAYKDLDIAFVNKSTNAAGPLGANVKTDIKTVKDAEAIRQSIRNILLTGRGEKPFMPMFGTDIQNLLFELDTEFDEDILEDEIMRALKTFEPRCLVRKIRTEIPENQHSVKVIVEFQVINSTQYASVEVDIARVR